MNAYEVSGCVPQPVLCIIQDIWIKTKALIELRFFDADF
jgi:hypothetical protein